MPIITLNNGNHYQYKNPISPLEFAKDIGYEKIVKNFIAAQINEKLIDIVDLIKYNVKLNFITTKNKISLHIIRHSCSHLLGRAIKKLWPSAKMITNTVINTGFFYDIELDYRLTQDDLLLLEEYMKNFSKRNYNIIKKTVNKEETIKLFETRNELYKIDMLHKHNTNAINHLNLYYHEEYVDICQGPHVPNISFCRYFKLEKILEFCWKKKYENKKFQRIYGTAWTNQYQLKTYLHDISKEKKSDHRILSQQLDLYHTQECAPGMIFWHKNGWILFYELKKFIRKQLSKHQYQEVKSPTLIDKKLWIKTGHWENYSQNIFTTLSENRQYCIKPMNCPGHIKIFKKIIKSYKDLPIRLAEFGICHRNEPSGSLHGLLRTKEFTQDDGHIFCTTEQIYNELNSCIKMMYYIYNKLGFKKILVKLSTRPKKRIGNDDIWNFSENKLSTVLHDNNIKFTYQPNDGAFYGPKIEFSLLDSLNRIWQCGTIQLDCSLSKLLNAYYIDYNNKRVFPMIIHRAILGSIERFIGILTEEYSGNFPIWLAPVQIILTNITEQQSKYVLSIEKDFLKNNIRTIVDLRNEKIEFKIRYHTIRKVPYILICGNQEMKSNTVSVRTCKGKNLGNYNVDLFIEKIKKEISSYSFH